jgi:DNA invertase Pin-like site-specific DNA recombinase
MSPDEKLQAAGASWLEARHHERERASDLYQAIRDFIAEGGTEVAAARLAGCDRMTVRRALGKR